MDMPHQTIMAELMIEHYGTIFTRYLQEHNIVYSETPAMRRVRRPRPVEPVYATVPDVVAEMAALSSPPPLAPVPTRIDIPITPTASAGSVFPTTPLTSTASAAVAQGSSSSGAGHTSMGNASAGISARGEANAPSSFRTETPLRAAPAPPSHAGSSPSLRSHHAHSVGRRSQSQDLMNNDMPQAMLSPVSPSPAITVGLGVTGALSATILTSSAPSAPMATIGNVLVATPLVSSTSASTVHGSGSTSVTNIGMGNTGSGSTSDKTSPMREQTESSEDEDSSLDASTLLHSMVEFEHGEV